VQGAEGLEVSFHFFVGDFFGMQLEVDPAIDAHGHYQPHVTGTRAEGEAIQGVYRALLFVRIYDDGLDFLPGEQLRDSGGKAETQK
jgi:hypothetical protein